MKKAHILLWIAGIILFVISVLYLLHLSQRDDDFFLEETSEIPTEVSTTANSTEQTTSPQTLLENFGENWLNFSNIEERNQRVKKYMTKEAFESDQLDTDTTEDRTSTGAVKSITQDIEDPQKYIILGEETTQEKNREVILEIRLTDEASPKIEHFESNYKE